MTKSIERRNIATVINISAVRVASKQIKYTFLYTTQFTKNIHRKWFKN